MYIPVPGSICFCSHCSYSECYKNLQVVPIDTWEDRGKLNKAKQPWAIVVNMSFLQHSVSWDGNQTSPAPQVKIPRLFQLYTISNKFVSQFSQHCLGRCLTSGHFPPFTKAHHLVSFWTFCLITFHFYPWWVLLVYHQNSRQHIYI